MTIVLKTEYHPHQTYTPSNSDDPVIQQLETRINELMLKLRQSENDWSEQGINTIAVLKNELDFVITQRNRLYQKLGELTEELKKSTDAMKENSTTIKAGGIGFGGAAVIAKICAFSPEMTIITVAAGTIAGIKIGRAVSQHPVEAKLKI